MKIRVGTEGEANHHLPIHTLPGGLRRPGCYTLRHRSIARCQLDEVRSRWAGIGEMASSESRRLSKLTTEAFSRLKNDHEQFLEAYESEL